MGIKVGTDVLGAVASVAVLGAAAKYGADAIGQALNPQQAKVAKMQADAAAMVRGSGVPPVYLKP